MACGENPKRVYGARGDALDADGQLRGRPADVARRARIRRRRPQERDLAMETLAGVLDGDILVQNHCYRADEMALVLDMAKEMGYHVAAFHHAVESYKIADLLREAGCARRCGPTGTASRWKPTTASPRTPR
jgi:imidazolonepropionase-like amidohydrolase